MWVRHGQKGTVGFQNVALVIHWIGKGIYIYHLQNNITKILLFDELKKDQCRFTSIILHTKSLISIDGFLLDIFNPRPLIRIMKSIYLAYGKYFDYCCSLFILGFRTFSKEFGYFVSCLSVNSFWVIWFVLVRSSWREFASRSGERLVPY